MSQNKEYEPKTHTKLSILFNLNFLRFHVMSVMTIFFHSLKRCNDVNEKNLFLF